MSINVQSDVGRLRKVILHRPGLELEAIAPSNFEEILFDDAPHLKTAQAEHDFFADTIRKNGVEVVYVEKLLEETLNLSDDLKKSYINDFLTRSGYKDSTFYHPLFEFLNSLDTKTLVDTVIAGLRKDAFKVAHKDTVEHHFLSQGTTLNDLFWFRPQPNLLFMRDPFSSVGKGVVISSMFKQARQREILIPWYIFNYHPEYKNTPIWYNGLESPYPIEGGDVFMLDHDTLVIGSSERSSPLAIEKIAESVLRKEQSGIKRVFIFDIPKGRAYMHLDTVFTHIDRDTFSVHSGAMDAMKAYEITLQNDHLRARAVEGDLESVLSSMIGQKAHLLPCGGGDPIHAEREQWNDGTNMLALGPRELIAYDRNDYTLAILKEKGFKIHEIRSSELSRGRGGPRCMSMSLIRENI